MSDAPQNDAAILAEIRALSGRLEAVGRDAREARDATIRLDARVGSEDTPTKIAEIAARIETIAKDARSDLVNAMDKHTRELREGQGAQDRRMDALALDMSTRLTSLEKWRSQLEGANGLVSWAAKNAGWLFAALAWGVTFYEGVRK